MAEQKQSKNNWTSQTEDRDLLNELLYEKMYSYDILAEGEQEYLLRATPSEDKLNIDLMIDGESTQVYVPKFLAQQFNSKATIMAKWETGYKLWAYRFDPVLNYLGFFSCEGVKETALTKHEEKKVKTLELDYPTFRDEFKKYEMIHYFNTFSRSKNLENGRQELENIEKCLNVYYEYFENEGKALFETYYPKHLDQTKEGKPNILSNGKSEMIRVLRPHLSIAMLVQTLPYLKHSSRKYVEPALHFAVTSAKALPETFQDLKSLTDSQMYKDVKNFRASNPDTSPLWVWEPKSLLEK